MSFVLQSRRSDFCPWQTWLLAFAWSAGFAAGIILSKMAVPHFYSLMRGSSFGTVSIVGLIVSAGIPFLISAFAVILSRPLFLHLICFCKAFVYMLFSVSMVDYYGNGGWLAQLLTMSHEILSFPILYTFWLRCLRFGRLPDFCECLGFISSEILVLTLTYRLMVPILAGLEIL